MTRQELLQLMPVWQMASTTAPSTHSLVTHVNNTGVTWCQWCGEHGVGADEPCSVMGAVRGFMMLHSRGSR